MRKNYVLDTNVLLQDANAIFKFQENHVYLPLTVIDELDGLKNSMDSETAYNARRANRTLKKLFCEQDKDFKKYIPLPDKGRLYPYISPVGVSASLDGLNPEKNDHKILAAVQEIQKKNSDALTILVTKDVSMQIKAKILGLIVEDYKNQQLEVSYTGRNICYVSSQIIDSLYQNKTVILTSEFGSDLYENEFLLLKASDNEQKQAVVMVKGDSLHLIKTEKTKHQKTPADKEETSLLKNLPLSVVRPMNLGQNYALHALSAHIEEIPLTILCGPAGSAKTFLALATGLDWVLSGKVRQVLLLRPQSFFDSEIGFLPGDEQSKIDPLLRPFYDNLALILELMGVAPENIQKEIEALFESGKLRAESFTYIRGRSITNSFIILDEAQNATRMQIKGAVTRAGMGSKIVLCGDPEQVDNPRLDSHNNGLVFAMNMMKASPLCAQVSFDKSECRRSRLAEDAIKRMF